MQAGHNGSAGNGRPVSNANPPEVSDVGFTEITGTIDIPAAGVYHLDGKHALWYARSRKTTSDFDRSRRQQAVLRGLWNKIKQQGLVGLLPALWSDVSRIVDTNLNVNDVAYLATFGLQLDDSRFKQRSIDRAALENFTTDTGAQVLLIAPERVQIVIDEAFTPPLSNLASKRRRRWKSSMAAGIRTGSCWRPIAWLLRASASQLYSVRSADHPHADHQLSDHQQGLALEPKGVPSPAWG